MVSPTGSFVHYAAEVELHINPHILLYLPMKIVEVVFRCRIQQPTNAFGLLNKRQLVNPHALVGFYHPWFQFL